MSIRLTEEEIKEQIAQAIRAYANQQIGIVVDAKIPPATLALTSDGQADKIFTLVLAHLASLAPEEAREQISRVVIRKVMALLANDKELFDHDVESLGLTTTSFSNNVADAILMEVWPIAEAGIKALNVRIEELEAQDMGLLNTSRQVMAKDFLVKILKPSGRASR